MQSRSNSPKSQVDCRRSHGSPAPSDAEVSIPELKNDHSMERPGPGKVSAPGTKADWATTKVQDARLFTTAQLVASVGAAKCVVAVRAKVRKNVEHYKSRGPEMSRLTRRGLLGLRPYQLRRAPSRRRFDIARRSWSRCHWHFRSIA